MNFVSTGKIVYEPFRGDMKNGAKNWCVVEVDKEITRYYRWWLTRHHHLHLQPPAWDAHISVVRGERIHPSVQHLWKNYHNQRVKFTYDHIVNFQASDDFDRGGHFYTINVHCELLDTIRTELQLYTGWKYHLTFGRTYQYQARVPKQHKK